MDPLAGRSGSRAGRLARLGVADAPVADEALSRAPWWRDDLLEEVAQAADPGQVIRAAIAVAAADPAAVAAVVADPDGWRRFSRVTGTSMALGDHLARHPEHLAILMSPVADDRDVKAELVEFTQGPDAGGGGGPSAADLLRVGYRAELLRIAVADLAEGASFEETTRRLSDLADAVLGAALVIAQRELPADAPPARLAIIAMGKCGGRELNYISDVDVIFVAEPSVAHQEGTGSAAVTQGMGEGAGIRNAGAEDSEERLADGTEAAGGHGAAGAEKADGGAADRAPAPGSAGSPGRSGGVDGASRPGLPGGRGSGETAALRTATQLATAVMRLCSEHTAEGTIWEVDAGLRPEGRAGALVRTLRSHVGYYERWAKTWEFQALLKARFAAGDAELGAAYIDAVLPFVWGAADREGFVADVQRMRQQVERHVPAKDADRQLKLGRGGLRDVEFSVQLLQLVHGRSDVLLRSPNTLLALEALANWGYVGREDAATLGAAYRFLRTLEHRIQLHRMARSHLVPRGDADLRRLGRAMGFTSHPGRELADAWQRRAQEVRRIHEKLFYRPLLDAVARLAPGQARLTTQAAQDRLDALGFADPSGALNHIQALTAGVSRRAAIQRTLLPVMLGWFADAPDPDAGLLGFRRVSDALGSTPWYLRLLRDESACAERLARVLASSRYASDLLVRAPDGVAVLADVAELRPRPAKALTAEFLATARRYEDAGKAVVAVRALRRRELFRIAATDLLGVLTVDDVGSALTDVADATIAGALEAAISSVERSRRAPLPTRMLVIGMGRFGGGELGYGSDADVVFVHDPLPGADEREATAAATQVASEVRALLNAPSADPPLALDTDLRPEGRQGPPVRTVASYASYYTRWRSFWEAQALLRADRVAGDEVAWQRIREGIDPIRWPESGIDHDQLREIRRLKARMEAERLPRGADPTLNTKLGRGGLSDVEWVIQMIQLQHANAVPALRTTRTLPALAAAQRSGLIEESDAQALADAWRMATRIRNVVMLVRGRATDQVPTDMRDLGAVARVLGNAPGESGELLEDYRRTTRRARLVMERLFYGQ